MQSTPARQVQLEQARVASPPQNASAELIPAAATAGTAAAAMTALLATLQGAPVAAGGAGTALEGAIKTAAIAQASTAILTAFDAAQADRRDAIPSRVEEKLAAELPDVSTASLAPLVRAEVERERAFQAKATERMRRDLPKALAIEDPEQRRVAVRKILERETRFAQQREDAIMARAGGQAEFDRMRSVLEPQGVTGMFWRLNPRLEHCARCLSLGGKIWPWTLLEMQHPPQHLNCGCKLWAPEDAFRLGWAIPKGVVSVDEAISMLHLLEATVDDRWDPEGLWLAEAVVRGGA